MKYNIAELFSKLKKLDRKHIQVLCMFLTLIVLNGMHTSMSVAIVAMTDSKSVDLSSKTLHWDSNEKSLILGSLCLGILTTQMPCGYVATAYSAKKLLCFGLLLSGFLHILTPIISQTGWLALVIFRVIEGLFQGCVAPCIHSLLGKWMSLSSRIRLGPLVLSGSQIGIVIAMSLSGVLAGSTWGWQSIFYVFGTASVLWGFAFYFIDLESPTKYAIETKTSEMKVQEIPWKAILSSKPVWSLVIASCGQSWNFFMFLTALPAYLKDVLNFNIQQTGGYSALLYFAMWIISLLFWWLSDYALRYGISKAVVRKTNNTIAMCGPALAMIILTLIETDKLAIITALIHVVALNGTVTCGHKANHFDLSQNFSAITLSISNTISNVFSLFASIIRGFIVTDTTDTKQWQTVFYITASINFVTNLVFVLFGEFEMQLWSEYDYSSSRYHDQACRISTITAAYGTTLKRINTRINTEFNVENENKNQSEQSENLKIYT